MLAQSLAGGGESAGWRGATGKEWSTLLMKAVTRFSAGKSAFGAGRTDVVFVEAVTAVHDGLSLVSAHALSRATVSVCTLCCCL